MTFAEALHQLEKGKVVARRSWSEFAKNFGIAVRNRGGKWKTLHRTCSRGWANDDAYFPTQIDIFAYDWEVVDAIPPEDEKI